MLFYSRKDIFFYTIIYGVVVFLLAIALNFHLTYKEEPKLGFDITMGLTVLLVLSCLHLTKYRITTEKFSYVCGPFFGSIKTDNITEVIVGKMLWVGLRVGTAQNGLILKYENGIFGEIYISPKTNELFIEELLKHNPNIKITQ